LLAEGADDRHRGDEKRDGAEVDGEQSTEHRYSLS
jgi:hypothetical protein